MAWEPKEGSGSLFKNDKGDNQSRPDYRGDLMVNGTLYEIAAWVKEGKKGKFLSLSASAKEEPKQQAPKKDAGTVADMDSDIPF